MAQLAASDRNRYTETETETKTQTQTKIETESCTHDAHTRRIHDAKQKSKRNTQESEANEQQRWG